MATRADWPGGRPEIRKLGGRSGGGSLQAWGMRGVEQALPHGIEHGFIQTDKPLFLGNFG